MKKTGLLFCSVLMLQMLFAQNPPVAGNDTFTINKNNPTTLYVTANDYDINGDPLTLTILIPCTHGIDSVSGNNIFHRPSFNYSGTDSFTYIICDTTGLCDTALVFITITATDNAPVASDDAYTVQPNSSTVLPVEGNDYDPDGDALTVSILTTPAHGTASVVGGQISYTSAPAFFGTDTLVYIICDSYNVCDTATVLITIVGNSNGPVANDDNYGVPQNTGTVLPVTANDYEPGGGTVTITILTAPQHGTASVINGTQVVYTPANAYYGTDTFVYILCNNNNLCDTAYVYLNINGTNQPPVSVDDSFDLAETVTTAELSVLQNDYDPELNLLNVAQVIDNDLYNNLGSLSLDSGKVIFTHNPLGCGTKTFQYLVCDYLRCDTGTITISIVCPTDIFLPEGFSPDGDGKNDRLVFTDLEHFAPASLKVFNRYGTTVYENGDYKNDWDGTALSSGKALPDGTYYYIMQLADKRHYNNYLIINR